MIKETYNATLLELKAVWHFTKDPTFDTSYAN